MDYKHYYLKNAEGIIVNWINDITSPSTEGFIYHSTTESAAAPFELMNQYNIYLYREGAEAGDVVARATEDVEAETLSAAKEVKNLEISRKTRRLINSKPFTYNSKEFGASETDQNNWNTFFNLSQMGKVVYPCNDKVKDWDGNYYSIPDQDEIENIIGAGEVFVGGYRDSDKSLKDQVDACSTVAEVEAIVDDRT